MLLALKHVFSDKTATISGFLAISLVRTLGMYFIDTDLIAGNMGQHRVTIEILLHIILSIEVGLFTAATVYKFRRFRHIPSKDVASGGIGSFLGLLVAGCSACSITIASYLGVSALLLYFPFKGLELKVVGILLLGRAIRDIYTHIDVCRLRHTPTKVTNASNNHL